MRKRVLVVDDEAAVKAALKRFLDTLDQDVVCASSSQEALAHMARAHFDLCITGLAMPDGDGFSVIAGARAQSPPLAVIVITGPGKVRDAVAALRAGAHDFISKPFHTSTVETSVRRCLEVSRHGAPSQPNYGAALLGEHPAIRLVLDRLEQVSNSEANVLIRGEEGTGKEVVARLLHASSPRGAGPFVSVNLSAIPPALVERELIGQTPIPGSGERSYAGKLLAAQGGTLFLREIADMPPSLQDRLFDVLRMRNVQPLGMSETIPIDVRIVASSSRNMDQMVKDGSFRADLFYRLNVIPIDLPALRERRDDIALLAEHLRTEMNARHGRRTPEFATDVLDRMRYYDWPGNVRQLAGVIERLVMAVGDRAATVADLPPNLRTSVLDLTHTQLDLPPSGVDLRLFLTELENRLIGQALQRTGGNKNRAAELLGLNRTTLVEKLKRRNVA